MNTYIYALFIDGETKYDNRNEMMTTNDPLFPYLKNCKYGPKVDFIKDDGSYSFGIKLFDYGFVINKNQTILPLLPGTIIEGPIKKMDLQKTQQVIYPNNLPIDNKNEEMTCNEADVSAELCTSVDDGLQASFGIMGDDLIFQQEDIELEEEIVCLQKNEEETSSILGQDYDQSEKMLKNKNDRKFDDFDKTIANNKVKGSLSSDFLESNNEVKGNMSSNNKKITKLTMKNKINRDIKDVANALVNFSSINEKMLLEKNKEGFEEEKVSKVKNHRKIKGSKLRKQGRKPSKLNISAKDLQNSDTEIIEQCTSNTIVKMTENLEYIKQNISNIIDFDNTSVSIMKESQQEAPCDVKDKNIDSDVLFKMNNFSENNSQLQIKSNSDPYNNERLMFPIEFQYQVSENIVIEKDIVLQDESNLLNVSKVKTPVFKTIFADVLKNQEYNLNSETGKSSKEIDINIDQNIKDVDYKSNIPLIGIKNEIKMNKVIEVNKIIPIYENEPVAIVDEENTPDITEQLTDDPILLGFIYNHNKFIYKPNKKSNVETMSKDLLVIMQRINLLEEERLEMQDKIRKEELRLNSWEKDLALREKNMKKRRSYRRKQ